MTTKSVEPTTLVKLEKTTLSQLKGATTTSMVTIVVEDSVTILPTRLNVQVQLWESTPVKLPHGTMWTAETVIQWPTAIVAEEPRPCSTTTLLKAASVTHAMAWMASMWLFQLAPTIWILMEPPVTAASKSVEDTTKCSASAQKILDSLKAMLSPTGSEEPFLSSTLWSEAWFLLQAFCSFNDLTTLWISFKHFSIVLFSFRIFCLFERIPKIDKSYFCQMDRKQIFHKQKETSMLISNKWHLFSS